MVDKIYVFTTLNVEGVYEPDDDVDAKIKRISDNTIIDGTPLEAGRYWFEDIPPGFYKAYDGLVELPHVFGAGEYISDGTVKGSDIIGAISVSNVPTLIPATRLSGGSVANANYDCLIGCTDNIQETFDDIATELGNVVHRTGNEDIAGLKTFNEYILIGDAVEAPTNPRHVVTKDYADTSISTLSGNVVHRTGNEDIAGLKTFNEYILIDDALEVPTNPRHVVTKDYADTLVAGITAEEQSVNKRIVFPDLTADVANKRYKTIVGASGNFGVLTEAKQGVIEIQGSGASSRYIKALAGTSKDYLTLTGGKHFNIVVYEGSVNKKQTYKDLKIIFGAGIATGNSTGARTYNQHRFENCIIYCFQDVTFTACYIDETCKIISYAGKTVTITGAGETYGRFYATVIKASYTGISDYTDGETGLIMFDEDPTSDAGF